MSRTHGWQFIVLVSLLTLGCAVAQTQQAAVAQTQQGATAQNQKGVIPQTKKAPVAKTQLHRKSHKAPPTQAALPPALPAMPRGPLPQLPMDLMPPAPPKVSYQNGLLTIVAQNSTLSDILRDLHKLTGASIEVPPNATERVFARLGPGEPREVLASLLNGSSFNYVMMGSSSNPTGVASVVLTAKTVAGATPSAPPNPYQQAQSIYTPQTPVPVPAPQPVVGAVVTQPDAPEADDSASAEEQEAVDENADQIQNETQQPDANGAVQPQVLQQVQPQPQQPNAGPRTPEQILEMLRQQQSIAPSIQNPPPPPDE